MAFEGNDSPHMFLFKELFNDQYFLLSFIMTRYLGPDVNSDNPRRSASQRLAQGLPPYTSENLGFSFISISQLESLYYYVLRNAHCSLVLEPSVLHMYLKGNLPLPSSELQDYCLQFTSFFPESIHTHKRYSQYNEIVKGIVLIDDPITSYMKEEDLDRFRRLSGIKDLKIDKIKCLSYEGGYNNCIRNCREIAADSTFSGKDNSLAKFQETYKRRDHLPKLQSLNLESASKQHSGEGVLQRTCKSDGPSMMRLFAVPNVDQCIADGSVSLTGTATKGLAGPPVGAVDIGISKRAYFFRVALPGVRRDYCEFSCEIECNGKVHIQGLTSGGKTIKKHSRVFQMNLQQLCPPGQFTVSFSLPGPVDPRLFSPNYRSDGIFEGIIIKGN